MDRFDPYDQYEPESPAAPSLKAILLLFVVVALVLIGVKLAVGQTQTQTPAKVLPPTVELPADQQIAILRAHDNVMTAQAEKEKLQRQEKEKDDEIGRLIDALNSAVRVAGESVKVEPKNYSFDYDHLLFRRIDKPEEKKK